MKGVFPLLFYFITYASSATETLSFNNEIALKLNIKEPVCRLSSLNKLVDFGEFDKKEVLTTPPEVSAIFEFTDCSGVNYINMGFTGNYIDSYNNQLKIAEGVNYASGLAIKLYDSSANEIKLSEKNNFYIGGSMNYNLILMAKIIPDNNQPKEITPGNIKSAVTLVISYE